VENIRRYCTFRAKHALETEAVLVGLLLRACIKECLQLNMDLRKGAHLALAERIATNLNHAHT